MTEEEKKEFEEFLQWKAEKAKQAEKVEQDKQDNQDKLAESAVGDEANVPLQKDSAQNTTNTSSDVPKECNR